MIIFFVWLSYIPCNIKKVTLASIHLAHWTDLLSRSHRRERTFFYSFLCVIPGFKETNLVRFMRPRRGCCSAHEDENYRTSIRRKVSPYSFHCVQHEIGLKFYQCWFTSFNLFTRVPSDRWLRLVMREIWRRYGSCWMMVESLFTIPPRMESHCYH